MPPMNKIISKKYINSAKIKLQCFGGYLSSSLTKTEIPDVARGNMNIEEVCWLFFFVSIRDLCPILPRCYIKFNNSVVLGFLTEFCGYLNLNIVKVK